MNTGIALLISVIIGSSTCDVIEIQTTWGPVQGTSLSTGFKSIIVFKDIPFAKAPVNESRFQKPLDAIPWTSSRPIELNKVTACPQFSYHSNQAVDGELIGSEDCLFLDVYAAKVPSNSRKKLYLPVVVYFHGGRFVRGHKNEYQPSTLMNENDIICVIPNYRLGILGFMSTKDNALPGNLGLLDQRKALEWVSKNIASFGGDPSKVTIAGHGAGAASVGMHILSRESHSFFSAGISGSGTALDPWVVQESPEVAARNVASYTSCSRNSNENVIACLKTLPLSKLTDAQRAYPNMSFGPVVEKSLQPLFLTESPLRLYQNGDFAKVPYLAGVTRDEAAVEFYSGFSNAQAKMHLDKMVAYYIEPYFKNVTNLDVVIKAINYHYLRGKTADKYLDYAPEFISLLSDFLYNSGLEQTLKLHSDRMKDTWMYLFSFEGKKSLGDALGPAQYKGRYGVSHMEDVIYLFDTTFLPLTSADKTSSVKLMAEQLAQIWKTFIQTRQTQPSRRWARYNSTEMVYLELGESIGVKRNYKESEADFWTVLVRDLLEAVPQAFTPIPALNDNAAMWGVTGVAVVFAVLCVALAAVVVVTRKRIMRNCSVPVCTSHEGRSSKV